MYVYSLFNVCALHATYLFHNAHIHADLSARRLNGRASHLRAFINYSLGDICRMRMRNQKESGPAAVS